MKDLERNDMRGAAPHKKRMKKKLTEFSDIVYIKADDIEFFNTDGGLLGARYKEYSGRVNIVRIFPMSRKSEYLSVRDDDYCELGIIEKLDGFSEEQISLIDSELARRYFAPDITAVYDVKEEFGNMFWVCETEAGKRSFTVRDLSNNIINTPDGGIILIDTDGNRYTAKQPRKLGAKAMKYLDIWL